MTAKPQTRRGVKMPTEADERYEYIKAIVGMDGSLRWESRLVGNCRIARVSHDEDISKFTEWDIRSLTAAMLDVSADQLDVIDVVYD